MSIDIDEVVRMEQAASPRDVLLLDLGLVEVERSLLRALEKVGALNSGDQSLGTASEDNPRSQIQFAQGTLIALGTLCWTLIGNGILGVDDAEDFLALIEATAANWRKHNCPLRALPSKMLADRLRQMIAEKRDIDQTLAASRHVVRSARTQ
jgi:hypothetical protein